MLSTKHGSKENRNAYFREYRLLNAEKMRIYKREYNKKWRKEHGYHNEFNSKKKYPEKESARNKLLYAVKTGKIQKLPCSVCGKKAQAHHPDYSKPLEITWLCPFHHTQMHPDKIIGISKKEIEILRKRKLLYDKFLQKSKERRNKIVALREQGLTQKQIAQKLGITHQRVQQVCAKVKGG